jgi:DNA-directed RNA polymerase specialized sigma24 family protein
MRQPRALDVCLEKTPAARALALDLVTGMDLLRLKVLARLHARGLPPEIDWSDLLQEAISRVLDGSRPKPQGVPIVAFLSGVMRSIKAEHWRRARRKARQLPKLLVDMDPDAGTEAFNPERRLTAIQQLAAINQLFADDRQARQVIGGLHEGHTPEEICARHDMTKTDYNSTRKRMRRILLREGLRGPQP